MQKLPGYASGTSIYNCLISRHGDVFAMTQRLSLMHASILKPGEYKRQTGVRALSYWP